VQEARVEERARQQARRERRRAEPTARGPCHAPPSPPKALELVVKVLESWDSVIAVSRTTLERKLVRIARQAGMAMDRETAVARSCHAPPSTRK
jgi:hypothetical protein